MKMANNEQRQTWPKKDTIDEAIESLREGYTPEELREIGIKLIADEGESVEGRVDFSFEGIDQQKTWFFVRVPKSFSPGDRVCIIQLSDSLRRLDWVRDARDYYYQKIMAKREEVDHLKAENKRLVEENEKNAVRMADLLALEAEIARLQRELDEAKSENHRWWKAKDDAEWRELEIREKYERLKDAYDESLEVREKLEAKIAHLSNPENWEVEVTESAVSKAAHAYYGHTGYSGMGRQKIRDVLHAARPKLTVRPSDSTEVDDGESVEGVAVNIGKASLRVELGYWTPDWLRHGTRVRITRLLDEVTP
jgi:hypothetical protein